MDNERKSKNKSLDNLLLKSEDYRIELVRLTRAKAVKMERFNDVESGKLLFKEDVEKNLAEVVLAIKNQLLVLPSKLGAQMCLTSTPRQATKILADAIDDVLKDLAKIGAT